MIIATPPWPIMIVEIKSAVLSLSLSFLSEAKHYQALCLSWWTDLDWTIALDHFICRMQCCWSCHPYWVWFRSIWIESKCYCTLLYRFLKRLICQTFIRSLDHSITGSFDHWIIRSLDHSIMWLWDHHSIIWRLTLADYNWLFSRMTIADWEADYSRLELTIAEWL